MKTNPVSLRFVSWEEIERIETRDYKASEAQVKALIQELRHQIKSTRRAA